QSDQAALTSARPARRKPALASADQLVIGPAAVQLAARLPAFAAPPMPLCAVWVVDDDAAHPAAARLGAGVDELPAASSGETAEGEGVVRVGQVARPGC